MKCGFLPIYNRVISRKKLLCEKISKDTKDIWNGHYILEYNIFEKNKKRKCEFLVSANSGFPTDLIHWGKEYCSFKIGILDNIGDNDGSEFVDWIRSFYNEENKYYRFNIYDLEARDLCLYIITKDMQKVARFHLPCCVIKDPLFCSYNRQNPESPQIQITLCTKHSVSINHLNNIINL